VENIPPIREPLSLTALSIVNTAILVYWEDKMIKKASHYAIFEAKKETLLSLAALEKRCNMSINEYKSLGEVTLTPDDSYIYIDNGSDILAVAHLDTVKQERHFHHLTLGDNQEYIFSPALDDRLGVYIILDVLPQLGIKVDVLLTDNEERGQSNAYHFKTKKNYRWLFQFDRAEVNDVAMYDYLSQKYVDIFSKYGLSAVSGSYTDIRDMTHLQRIGFNFSVGYDMRECHSLFSHAKIRDILACIGSFVRFYDDNKNKRHVYKERKIKAQKWQSSGSGHNYGLTLDFIKDYNKALQSGHKKEPEYDAICFYCDTPIYDKKNLHLTPDGEPLCQYCAQYWQDENNPYYCEWCENGPLTDKEIQLSLKWSSTLYCNECLNIKTSEDNYNDRFLHGG
jgi:hypothetical protein